MKSHRDQIPVQAFIATLVLTILIVAGLGMLLWKSVQDIEQIWLETAKIDDLSDNLTYFEEVSDMAVRMTVVANNLTWEERDLTYQARIRENIMEIMNKSPDISITNKASELNASNRKLAELHLRVYELIRGGQQNDAKALLNSFEYQTARNIFAKANNEINIKLTQNSQEARASQDRVMFMALFSAAISIPLLILFWLGVLQVIKDHISQRKTALENLQRERDLITRITETSPAGILLINATGRITFANAGAEKIFDLRKDSIIGRSYNAAEWHISDYQGNPISEDRLPFKQVWNSLTNVLDNQIAIKKSSGGRRFLNINSAPLFDEKGNFDGMVSMLEDITEKVEVQRAIQESEQRFRKIFEEGPMGMGILNTEFKFIEVNQTLCDILGYSENELRTLKFSDITHPDHIQRDIEQSEKLLKGEIPYYRAEERYIKKNKEIVWAELTAISLRDQKGEITQTLAMIDDISMRKAADEFASRRNRQLRLLSGAVRKINTVLEIPVIIQNLVSSAMELTEAEAGAAGRLINNKVVFSEYNQSGRLIPVDYAFEAGYGVAGVVMKTKSPYVSNDPVHDPSVIPEMQKSLEFYNLVNVPIMNRKGEFLGCIEIHNTKDHRPFDQLDIEMMQGLASSAAIALENASILSDIKRAEEEKIELSDIIEKSLNEIYMFDPDTLRFTYVNAGACKNIGYSLEVLKSLTPLDLNPEFNNESYRKLLEPLMMHDKNKIAFQTVHRRSDSSLYPVEVHLQLIEQPSKVFLAIVIDVTERQRAEKELRQSELKFRNLFETMAQGVIYQDSNGRITSCNRAAKRILGLTTSQLIGRTSIDPAWKAIHEDGSNFPGDMHPSMVALRTRREVSDVVMGVFNPDEDQYRWIVVHAVPQFRYGETKPFQVFTTFEDITGIKHAKEDIEAANMELLSINRIIAATSGLLDINKILEIVLDESLNIVGLDGGSIYLINPDDTMQLAVQKGASEAAINELTANKVKVGEGLCGISARDHKVIILPNRGAVLKFTTREAIRNEDLKFHAAFPLVTGGKCVGILCIFTRTDRKPSGKKLKILEIISSQVALSIQNAQLYSETKEYTVTLEKKVAKRTEELQENQEGLINLVDDLNRVAAELEEANERLRELDLTKSIFIASMSHEFRTPLNSIIGFSSILLEGWEGELSNDQKELIQIINVSGKHLLSLINDVIDISKIEAGKIEINISRFNSKEVIDEVVSIIRTEIDAKGLSITVDAKDVEINTDRKRLFQCIMNLVSNAVKFTEEGEINIIAKAINKELEISIVDTGIGIRKEDLPKLFGAFVRLDSPLTTKTSGTGLGLYLTHKLAKEVLKGEVTAESEFGKGSKFSLRIPREV